MGGGRGQGAALPCRLPGVSAAAPLPLVRALACRDIATTPPHCVHN
jgi:hypothetical protein